MTQADRERWDRKYTAGNPNPAFAPSPLLVQYAHLLDGRGLALDVACGVGQNAIFLADRGYEVLAVDGSLVGLRYCQAAIAGTGRRIHLVAADLGRFVFPRAAFALVIVFRFLDRALLPQIKEALAPGGLLIYETFNINQLRWRPEMTRSYLLEPGELARGFADLECIATNDTAANTAELTHWIGRRGTSAVARV